MWHEVQGVNGSRGRSGRGGQKASKGGTPSGNTVKTNPKLTVGQESITRQHDSHDNKTRNTAMMPPRGRSERGVRTTNKVETPIENGTEKIPQPMGINESERETVIQNNYACTGTRGRMEKATPTSTATRTESHEEKLPVLLQ